MERISSIQFTWQTSGQTKQTIHPVSFGLTFFDTCWWTKIQFFTVWYHEKIHENPVQKTSGCSSSQLIPKQPNKAPRKFLTPEWYLLGMCFGRDPGRLPHNFIQRLNTCTIWGVMSYLTIPLDNPCFKKSWICSWDKLELMLFINFT